MASPDERDPMIQEELAALAQEYETRQDESSPTAEWELFTDPVEPEVPVTVHDLNQFLSTSRDISSEARDLTYGSARLDSLIRLPPPSARPDLVKLEDINQIRRVGYYHFAKGRWTPIRNVRDLVEVAEKAPLEEPESAVDVQRLFEADCRRLREESR
jgi:hypothetical protein